MKNLLAIAALIAAVVTIAGVGSWFRGLDARADAAEALSDQNRKANEVQDGILKDLTEIHQRQEIIVEALCRSGSIPPTDPRCLVLPPFPPPRPAPAPAPRDPQSFKIPPVPGRDHDCERWEIQHRWQTR